jgi:histidinol-phosphate phosphatase family protein
MMQGVILAGGEGTRLRSRLVGVPKPLVDVDGVPLLGRQLALLRACGCDDAVILVNYGADHIRQYCAANANFGLRLRLIDDGEPRGTAGAVLAALDQLAERFIVVYGDTLINVDLQRFWRTHGERGADATLFVHPNDHPHDSDIVEVDDIGWIQAFHPYPHPPHPYLPNMVNAGLYVIERAALGRWRDFAPPADFAKQLFPAMLGKGCRLHGYASFEYIKDIGTPARLDAAVEQLRCGVVTRASLAVRQQAIFADRDGTLNVHRDYVRTPEQLELIDGVPQAVRRLNQAEYRVVLVTNQPVVARGECTVEGLRHIHAKLETELGRGGAFLDRILFCPHHPERGFPGEIAALKVKCACRKPGTALVEAAARELNIDLARSWLVGDSAADVLTAQRAGLRSILVGPDGPLRDAGLAASPDFAVGDFPAAVRFILDVHPHLVHALTPVLQRIGDGEVVLIGGLAKIGKSTLARAMAAELRAHGLSASIISLDRWIRPVGERGCGVLERFDLASAAEALAPWLEQTGTARLRLPIYDRMTRQRREVHDELDIAADAVLILEGVPALTMALPGSRRVHRIHVEGTEAARRLRVLCDLMVRGSDAVGAEAIYAERMGDETPVVAAARDRAQHILGLDAVLGRTDTGQRHDH